jgi:exopolysaccharide biosynthesis polyprenyl glycosylphosphotransferase
MTRHQARFLCHLLLAGDVALSAVAFACAIELRQWLSTTEIGASLGSLAAIESYGPLLLGMMPLWALAFHVTGSGDVRSSLGVAARRHLRAVGLGLLLLIGASFLLHLQFVSRGFVLLLAAAQLGLLWAVRAVVLGWLRRREIDHRVLIVGCDETAVRFADALRLRAWSQRLVGFVGVPGQARLAAATPVVAEVDALAELLDREPIDEVVFTMEERRSPHVHAAIDACQTRGVDVLMTMPAALPCHGRVEMAELSTVGMPMLSVCRGPKGQGPLVAKRLLDVLGAGLLLLLTTPVLLVVALAIRIESRGPVLFAQVRAGRHGRRFTMLKLRSMVVDAEARRAELAQLDEKGSPELEIRRDPRVTRVGAFIRATSIDELPQLINVLLGHMSLVGPRPPLPAEVEQYEPWQRRRLSVRPGVTGPWQVSGRNDLDFEQWMKLDLRYIDSWSLRLDLEILARTLSAMMSRSGAS